MLGGFLGWLKHKVRSAKLANTKPHDAFLVRPTDEKRDNSPRKSFDTKKPSENLAGDIAQSSSRNQNNDEKKPTVDIKPDNNDATLFPRGLPEIIFDYLGDATVTDDKEMGAQQNVPSKHDHFKFFSGTMNKLISAKVTMDIGNLILRGGEEEVEKALDLVRRNPVLLRPKTIATDPLGRRTEGTLLQIAAMAGDGNLKPEIRDEKDRGLVERLITAGNLSKEEVIEQLQVITSEEAKQANEARNQRVLDVIKRFGTGICEVKADANMSFEAFQARCKPLITQLEKDLQPDTKGVSTSGYIFDPKILQEAAEWFEENANKRFGGWWSRQSDVFWVNGFGKLQSKLSSRDAQVIRAGIGYLVDDGKCPGRTLNNANGTSFFFNSASRLGVEFYLGYSGLRHTTSRAASGQPWLRSSLARLMLMLSKNRSIANLCNAPKIGRGLNLAV